MDQQSDSPMLSKESTVPVDNEFTDTAKVAVRDFLVIRDPDSGQIILETKGKRS